MAQSLARSEMGLYNQATARLEAWRAKMTALGMGKTEQDYAIGEAVRIATRSVCGPWPVLDEVQRVYQARLGGWIPVVEAKSGARPFDIRWDRVALTRHLNDKFGIRY